MKFNSPCAILVLVTIYSQICVSKRHSGVRKNVIPVVKMIEVKAGKNISLICKDFHSNHHNPVNNGITWDQLPCESNDYNDCDTENANDIGTSKKWRSLSEFSGLGNLIIKDVKESNAGLYRCMDNRRIKKLFDVKVRNFDTSSNDMNTTVDDVVDLDLVYTPAYKSMHFIIRCNVTLSAPVKIIWFKRCEQNSKSVLNEDGLYYCHIVSNITSYSNRDVNLSKLKIYNAQHSDSGVYVCVAITGMGRFDKTIVVDIPKVDEEEGISLLLFLIPCVLFIPILLVWLCYHFRKWRSKSMRYMRPTKIVAQPQERI